MNHFGIFTRMCLPLLCMSFFFGCGTTKKLQVGDAAPEITLHAMDGSSRTLASYKDEAIVVLYFYPKDDTPGCTKQACTFRDSYEAFTDAGAVVIGISGDSAESHKSFAEKYSLPFTLVTDAEGKIRAAFGVSKTMGMLPGRVTYVIDKKGKIRYIFNSQMQPEKHVTEALRIVKELTEKEGE